ncbi:MAG: DUF4012 domain-containing protein [Candidatus Liptonbacteria bacterium]|nr:DUF4012 domain-containing protein [Candidatus Liptonbacteria bacterium]
MKRKVPRKNVSSDLADIQKNPGINDAYQKKRLFSDGNFNERVFPQFFGTEKAESKNGFSVPAPSRGKKKFIKKLVFISLGVFVIVALLWGAGVYAKWNNLIGYFNLASGDVGHLLLKTNGDNADSYLGDSRLSVLDLVKTKSLWENAGSIYSSFQNFSLAGMGLIRELEDFTENWPKLLLSGDGQELISKLENTKKYIELINESNNKLNSLDLGIDNFLSGGYGSPLSVQLNFRRMNDFLFALINFLSSEEDKHILVLFENSSEIRPSGGFIGSYADVIFSGGNVKSVEVHDINDPDKLLEENIIPPKPLQAIEKAWTIADSNWFFDAGLSMSKAIELMEKSKMYAGKVSFDGAIAISPKVLGDVLELTGPIKLENRDLIIDKNNFLKEIQKEVQNAQAGGTKSKKIIIELVPQFLSRLVSLQPKDSSAATEKFYEWIRNKDIVMYFKDPAFENFADFYGISGKVLDLPADFNGDYLAVVNANVGGGKSDFLMGQKVFFKTQLNSDGTAVNQLEVERRHNGGKNDPWWYRLTNETYSKIFVPGTTSLSSFGGGWDRKIVPKTDYSKNGYKSDPLVFEIESTSKKNFLYPGVDEFRESGKKVFGFWTKTDPGKTSRIILNYSVNLFSPAKSGQKYEFIFQKQSGSEGTYKLEIYAPVGFIWKENNSPVFEYETDNPEGTMTFGLTMEKI